MKYSAEWTPNHAAARIACGNLEGEASALLERKVRMAWQSMCADDMVGEDAHYDYVKDSPPVSTHRLWEAFGECSALRCMLDRELENVSVCSMRDLDSHMRVAFIRCAAEALAFMPAALEEVNAAT